MTTLTTSVPILAPRERGLTLRDHFARALRRVRVWRERTCQRAVLADLDDHLLRDIGVTRAQARRECEKPFWR